MNIRKFQEADADEVSALIVTTLRTTNIKDYSFEYIENDVKILQPYNILERAGWTHFYVACDDNKIVGCGAIGPYWDKENESSLFTIFVLPEYQGRGIGRKIIEMLEELKFPPLLQERLFIERWVMITKTAFAHPMKRVC